jgi:Helix-turn-helix domain
MPLNDFGLLTLAAVAELLHCSKAHVSNLVAGRVPDCPPIPALRLGRRTVVRYASLVRWIEENDKITSSPERGRKSA